MLPEKNRCPVIYLGLSLDYYRVNNPDRVRGYGAVFATWRDKLAQRFDIKASALCWSRDEVSALLRSPEAAGARAVVVSPLSYTASAASEMSESEPASPSTPSEQFVAFIAMKRTAEAHGT